MILVFEAGTKSKTIVNLETDMQRSLMSQNINIIEVVPGTPYVGIEVQMISAR